MSNDVDINYRADFERAVERLQHAAGKISRQYWKAKHGNGSEEEIARLRQAYIVARCRGDQSGAGQTDLTTHPKKNARARRAFLSSKASTLRK